MAPNSTVTGFLIYPVRITIPNAETPAHLLDHAITPTDRHFIRNNGVPPENPSVDAWSLTIDGLVNTPMTLSIADLKSKFNVVERAQTYLQVAEREGRFERPAGVTYRFAGNWSKLGRSWIELV